MRPSSTKGKHIVLQSPALPKGAACVSCKQRKVRCDGVKPACGSCRRTARFEGRDESEVRCCFEGKRPSPRRSRKPSSEQESRTGSMDGLPELPLLPLSGSSQEAAVDYNALASALMAYTRMGSTSSSSMSSSSSSSMSFPPTMTASPESFVTLGSSFPSYLPPQQSLSASPLPMLDSADYFSALNFAPSTTVSTSFSTPDMKSALSYPPVDLPSLFSSFNSKPAQSPKNWKPDEPSYFDFPPPVESKEWPDQGQPMATGIDWSIASTIPLTPGFSIDYSLLAATF